MSWFRRQLISKLARGLANLEISYLISKLAGPLASQKISKRVSKVAEFPI